MSRRRKTAMLCKCGGGQTHHTIEPECWCPNCLRLPEAERCREFESVAGEADERHWERPRVDKALDRDIQSRRQRLPRAGTFKRQIFDQIGKMRGATDDELEYATGKSHQSVSAARNSLLEDDLIFDSGERRPTRYGNDAIVWNRYAV